MATTFTILSHACSLCAVTEQYTVCPTSGGGIYICYDCLECFQRGITDALKDGYRSPSGTSATYDTATILTEKSGRAHS